MANSDEFKEISSLRECVQLAESIVEESAKEYCINFSVKVRFPISLVLVSELKDVEQLAEDFQNPEKPDHLYLNHGEFITPLGVPHVIEELRNKHNGNRAIISLISQNDILKKGDDPIPSFMILQFSLEADNTLYVTTYFRALEVSKFFRINIEEIRIICNQIYSQLKKIEFVNLHVIAFRGYINPKINTLVRPKIESMRDGKILALLQDDVGQLADLLKEKLYDTTFVENNSLKYIKENINDPTVNKRINGTLTNPHFKTLVDACLDSAEQLSSIRIISSHHTDIKPISDKYLENLSLLIAEVEKCR
ncbi:MAG: hypothetical protein GJV46_10670 [Geobacter sp.]|nr:hypothetical protein [Geobacter sp.]